MSFKTAAVILAITPALTLAIASPTFTDTFDGTFKNPVLYEERSLGGSSITQNDELTFVGTQFESPEYTTRLFKIPVGGFARVDIRVHDYSPSFTSGFLRLSTNTTGTAHLSSIATSSTSSTTMVSPLPATATPAPTLAKARRSASPPTLSRQSRSSAPTRASPTTASTTQSTAARSFSIPCPFRPTPAIFTSRFKPAAPAASSPTTISPFPSAPLRSHARSRH